MPEVQTPAAVTAPVATEAKSAPVSSEPSSLSAFETGLASRAQQAKSPLAIRNLIKEAKNQPQAPKQEATQPEAVPQAAPEATPEAPAVNDPEATVPEAETPAATEPESTEDAPETDDDGNAPVKPATAKQLRLRLPENDEVGRLTAALLQRNRDWTLPEAFAAAQKQLGVKPAAETAQVAAPANPDLPQTPEAVDATLEQLETDMEKAEVELRFEEASKLRRKIRQLDRHRLTLERDAERQQTAAVQEYSTKFAQAESKAVELYAFAADPESPGGQRMKEIEDAMETTGDPLFHSPDKPLKIAQMVAAELNIAPRRKGAPVTPAKVAAPVVAPKPKQVLPNGGSRTTQPVANAQPAINDQIAKIRTPRDYRLFMKPLLQPVRR